MGVVMRCDWWEVRRSCIKACVSYMSRRHREMVTTKGWGEFAARRPVLAAELLARATLDSYHGEMGGRGAGVSPSGSSSSPIGWFKRKLR